MSPGGAAARRYGVYRAEGGITERALFALFVIDAGGTIRSSHGSPVAVDPGADGILTAPGAIGADPTSTNGATP